MFLIYYIIIIMRLSNINTTKQQNGAFKTLKRQEFIPCLYLIFPQTLLPSFLLLDFPSFSTKKKCQSAKGKGAYYT